MRRERRRSLVAWASFRGGRNCSFADEEHERTSREGENEGQTVIIVPCAP